MIEGNLSSMGVSPNYPYSIPRGAGARQWHRPRSKRRTLSRFGSKGSRILQPYVGGPQCQYITGWVWLKNMQELTDRTPNAGLVKRIWGVNIVSHTPLRQVSLILGLHHLTLLLLLMLPIDMSVMILLVVIVILQWWLHVVIPACLS